MPGQELGDRDLVLREVPQAHLVELDEPPRLVADADREHEHRVHLELAQDESLRRVDVALEERDRAGLARSQDLRGEREILDAVGDVVSQPDVAQRVSGQVDEVSVDHSRH